MEYSNELNVFILIKYSIFCVVEPYIKDAVVHTETLESTERSFAIATKARKPLVATASMDIWYARLGHIRKEALEHMPNAVEGVVLGTREFERDSELCEECQLAQAYNRNLHFLV